MGEKFAPLQSGLAALDGLDEAVFFLEVRSDNVLHGLIKVPALFGRSLRKASLQGRSEVYLHTIQDTGKADLL